MTDYRHRHQIFAIDCIYSVNKKNCIICHGAQNIVHMEASFSINKTGRDGRDITAQSTGCGIPVPNLSQMNPLNLSPSQSP